MTTEDETEQLRARAQRGLQRRELPRKPPRRLYGGYGSGRRCALCNAVIRSTQIEYELVFCEDCTSDAPVVSFHQPCHAIYESERSAWPE